MLSAKAEHVAHTPKVKVCAEVEHEFLKHGGMNFCPNCGANVKDKANSLARAAAPELLEALKAAEPLLKVLASVAFRPEVGQLLPYGTLGRLTEWLKANRAEAAISKAEHGQ